MSWPPARRRRAIACVLLAAEHLPFLRDWCRHHIAQGWDLVLYDNTGSVGSERLDAPEFHVGEVQREGRDKRDNHYGAWRVKLDDQQLRRRLLLAVAGLPVTVHEWRPRNCAGEIVHGQVEAYAEFVATYRDTYEWAGFIDADEYLRAAKGRDWDELLDLAEQSGCGSVMLDGLVLDARWTSDGRPRDRRLERTHGPQLGMKTLAKLDDVLRVDVHWVISRAPDTLHPQRGVYWFDHRNGSPAEDVAIQRLALPADNPDSVAPPALPRSLPALALPVEQRFGSADHDAAGDDPLSQLLALLRQDPAAGVTDWGGVRALAEAHQLGPAVWSAIAKRGSRQLARSSAETSWAWSADERERERGATLEAVAAEATARLAAFGIEHVVLAGPRPLLRDRTREILSAREPILVVEPNARDVALAIFGDACWRIDRTAHNGAPAAPLSLAPPDAAGEKPVVSGAPARALWPLRPDRAAQEGPVPTATTVAVLALAAPDHAGGGAPLRALWELTVLASDSLGMAIDWSAVRVAFAAAGAELWLDNRLRLARRLFGADLPRPATGGTVGVGYRASSVRDGRPHRGRNTGNRPESDADELREQPFRAFDAIFCLTPEPDAGQWAAIQARLEILGIKRRVKPLAVADGYAAYAAGWRETIAIAARHRYEQVLVLDHEAVFLDTTSDVLFRAMTELRGRRWDLLFLGAAVFGMRFPFANEASTLQRCGPVTGTFALAVHRARVRATAGRDPPRRPRAGRLDRAHAGCQPVPVERTAQRPARRAHCGAASRFAAGPTALRRRRPRAS